LTVQPLFSTKDGKMAGGVEESPGSRDIAVIGKARPRHGDAEKNKNRTQARVPVPRGRQDRRWEKQNLTTEQHGFRNRK